MISGTRAARFTGTYGNSIIAFRPDRSAPFTAFFGDASQPGSTVSEITVVDAASGATANVALNGNSFVAVRLR